MQIEKIFSLSVYNALYAAPFLLVPLAFAAFGSSMLPLLELVSQLVERASAYLIPAVLGLLGLALVTDALLFFVRGEGLI